MAQTSQKMVMCLLALMCLISCHSMGISQTLNRNLHYRNPSLEFPDADLFAKVASSSVDFSEREMRMLVNYDCTCTHAPDEQGYIVSKKIDDLGESIQPLLVKMAWEHIEDYRVYSIINRFKKNDDNGFSEEMRRIILESLAHSERGSGSVSIGCRVMTDIGKPEDVPKLLSIVNENAYIHSINDIKRKFGANDIDTYLNMPENHRVFRNADDNLESFYHIIRAVGSIAVVSQIPEIEKAIENWTKEMLLDSWWLKTFQAEVTMCLANIRREPEDVPKLLLLLSQDEERRLLKPVLRLVSNIAAVSQMPEIEKAITAWKEKHFNDNLPLEKQYLFEIELYLANIRRDPKDVTKLLSFMVSDFRKPELFSHWLQVLGNIATISQIPEIEQVIATLAEDEIPGIPYEKWPKEVRDKIEASFENIRERNVP